MSIDTDPPWSQTYRILPSNRSCEPLEIHCRKSVNGRFLLGTRVPWYVVLPGTVPDSTESLVVVLRSSSTWYGQACSPPAVINRTYYWYIPGTKLKLVQAVLRNRQANRVPLDLEVCIRLSPIHRIWSDHEPNKIILSGLNLAAILLTISYIFDISIIPFINWNASYHFFLLVKFSNPLIIVCGCVELPGM